MARELYQLPANGLVTDIGGAGLITGTAEWVLESDSVNTTASRQAITAGTRTLFTVDGLGETTEESFSDTLPTDIWDTDTINPAVVGEVYNVRVGLSVAPTFVSEGYLELQLDIGSGAQIIVFENLFSLQKGNGVTHYIYAFFPILCLTTFITNGGKFYITPSINVEVWDRNIFLQRTCSP